MANRPVKDAKDGSTGELIYFKSHANAVYTSDGKTVETKLSEMQSAIPSNVSQLSNDKGYLVAADISGKLDSNTASSTYATKSETNAKYTKPSTGIPKTDLASDVQTTLTNALSSDGTITRIVYASSLPANPDAKTLYLIP